jgi:hypothetical protein
LSEFDNESSRALPVGFSSVEKSFVGFSARAALGGAGKFISGSPAKLIFP